MPSDIVDWYIVVKYIDISNLVDWYIVDGYNIVV